MRYKVYQNITQFACEVEADNEKQAIRLAQELGNWTEYEPVEENIFYDTILQELPAEKDIILPQEPPRVVECFDDLPEKIKEHVHEELKKDILNRFDNSSYHNEDIIHNTLQEVGYKIKD